MNLISSHLFPLFRVVMPTSDWIIILTLGIDYYNISRTSVKYFPVQASNINHFCRFIKKKVKTIKSDILTCAEPLVSLCSDLCGHVHYLALWKHPTDNQNTNHRQGERWSNFKHRTTPLLSLCSQWLKSIGPRLTSINNIVTDESKRVR